MSLCGYRKSLRISVSAIFVLCALIVIGCGVSLPQVIGNTPPPTNDPTDIPPRTPTQPVIPPASVPDAAKIEIKAAPVFCCNPLTIDFNAVITNQSVSSFKAYKWDFGDARTGTGKTTTHTYTRSGIYSVELVLEHTDGTAQLATLDLPVGVYDPDLPNPDPDDDDEYPPDDSDEDPTTDPEDIVHANAGQDQVVNSGAEVTISGAASTAEGTETLLFSWRQVGGPSVQLVSAQSETATFSAPGNLENATDLTFELTAFVEGASERDQVKITVLASESEEPPSDPALPSQQQLVAWMQELPPLPKTHYSFPLQPAFLGEPISPLVYQYVRLARAISLSSEAKDWQISTAVNVCDQINGLGDGGLAAGIAINHSPWHVSFPSDLPPTHFGPEHDAEIEAFRQRLITFRATLASVNSARGAQVPVTAILFDTERFYVKETVEPGAAQWNAAIDAKYAPFYEIAKQLFPAARVEWYGRGIQESQGATGWSPFPWFTFDEPADTLACSLYRVSELETMRETFRRTHELALDLGFSQVTPWIALGAGYRRDAELFQVWQQDWNFDPVYSLLLGREVNQWWHATLPDRFAPWDAAQVVVFYPAPFDPRSPAWGKHFIAYARGAAGRNDSP